MEDGGGGTGKPRQPCGYNTSDERRPSRRLGNLTIYKHIGVGVGCKLEPVPVSRYGGVRVVVVVGQL